MSNISTKDKIDRKELVNKVTTLVQELPNGEHICVGLNGEWGSGKTFVMQMLHEFFATQPEYLVIDYDAWKNNFYQDPLIGILSCIVDGIQSYIRINNVAEKVKKGFMQTCGSIGNDILSAMKQAGGRIALFAYAIEGVKNIRKAKPKFEDCKQLEDFKSYSTLLDEVKEQLNFITQRTIDNGKQIKLVILVDEIDRCLPNEQLIVLERLHHLFDVNNCAVVLAMNKKQIVNTFNNTYSANGNEYLRKFFDYEFYLPMLNSVFFINQLISEVIENNQLEFIKPISKQEVEFIQQYIFSSLKSSFENGKIDNRSLNKIVKNIESIALKMPDKKLDFAYLFIISYLVSSQLFNVDIFVKLLNREDDAFCDFFKEQADKSSFAKVYSIWKLDNFKIINLYVNEDLNNVNFYFNIWADEFNKNSEISLNTIYRGCISYDPDYKEKLTFIFKSISVLGA